MPRAHRYFLPHHVWHLTHRCHQRDFLLKFARDRRRWRQWLFEAKKRFRLCVLNYAVTSNHIHLLVRDQGRGEIAHAMQLIAGCTAQAYNHRKARQGAFWEDRYHATAVDTEESLARCLVYIDLNMVRAGVVQHPGDWDAGGYREIQSPPQRYAIIDLPALTEVLGMTSVEQLQATHAQWVAAALRAGRGQREPIWSESVAVGRREFVERVQGELGIKAQYREVVSDGQAHVLREPPAVYMVHGDGEKATLSGEKSVVSD